MKPKAVTVHDSSSPFFSETEEYYPFNHFEIICRLATQAAINDPSNFTEFPCYVEYTVHMDNGSNLRCSMSLSSDVGSFVDYTAWVLANPSSYDYLPTFKRLTDVEWVIH